MPPVGQSEWRPWHSFSIHSSLLAMAYYWLLCLYCEASFQPPLALPPLITFPHPSHAYITSLCFHLTLLALVHIWFRLVRPQRKSCLLWAMTVHHTALLTKGLFLWGQDHHLLAVTAVCHWALMSTVSNLQNCTSQRCLLSRQREILFIPLYIIPDLIHGWNRHIFTEQTLV